MFERFWRADRQGTGAGLGLAISLKRIVEASDGQIEIADALKVARLFAWSGVYRQGLDGADVAQRIACKVRANSRGSSGTPRFTPRRHCK